jgi:crotonobetainyl-CoA:carnitine CoA-transferase CaiB-like acyl-CoA transferase
MQPFENIRVIDMTHVLAGPFTTYQLAVLGADVIKVESPRDPDMTRVEGVTQALNDERYGTYFMAQNAGKRAISVDIKSAQGKRILMQLAETADVLVENYRGGVLDRLGLGYQDLKRVNPRLIYCSLTGFGHTGPKRHDPAYDTVIQAFSGLMAANGEANAPPVRVGPPLIDYGTGAQAALAISSALFQRERTGIGQRIDVAMLDAALMLMSAHVAAAQTNGQPPVAHGNAHPDYAGYAAYQTRDGMLMIGAWTNRQMANLYRALGDEARGDLVEKAPRAEIGARRDEDAAFLRVALAGKTADEWELILNRAGVPAARVRRLDEALAHEQVASRAVLQTYPGCDRDGAPKALPVAAFTFEHGGPAPQRPPPRAGEHTAELLTELGYTDADIDALEQKGVIR